jgi:lipoteichoic acid synthase
VESLQTFAVGLELDGHEVTPNLNKLLGESWYAPNTYTQIGKGNTSDAEFVLNTSLLGLRDTPASSAWGTREIPSLPRLLADQGGYESHTFHPNRLTFWSRDKLYPALGFDHYWPDTFFEEEDVIGIGPSDRVLYKRALPVLKEVHDEGGLVYANLITLSSHSPFMEAAERSDLPLPDHLQDTKIGYYLKSMNYTDETIGEFVEDLKEAGMWDESIVVIFGDHFGLAYTQITDGEFGQLREMLGYPYTVAEHFRVPMLVRTPGQTTGGVIDELIGFVDIMPTIAELAAIDLSETPHLGRSIFEGGAPIVHIRFYAAEGTFYHGDLKFRPGIGYEDAEVREAIGGERVELEAIPEELYERAVELLRVNNRYLSSLPRR